MIFDQAFDRLFGNEGGYTDGQGDPGGETNWGISKRSYPYLDIKGLTRDQAKNIYRVDFWSRIHAEELPGSVAFQAFDFAVNSGIETAIRYLQRAVKVADDGHWGPVTRMAVMQTSESDIILRYNGLRLQFMTTLSNWPMAGRGWARRIASNLLFGAIDT
jgi:lysozyme family protein